MILVYADESGTHDESGLLKHSAFPVIAGFAARKSSWNTFCIQWNAVLNAYGVDYFHAHELKYAESVLAGNFPITPDMAKNHYLSRNWDIPTIQSFRKKLTKIAASGNKIPIAGAVSIPKYVANKTPEWNQYPYSYAMDHFFSVYFYETKLQWGEFKSDVSFFFDQNNKELWKSNFEDVFSKWQRTDKRICAMAYADKKKYVNFPLQAADLLAHRIRQLAEDHENGCLEMTPLDQTLLKDLIKSGAIKYPELKKALNKTRSSKQ
jgi:Protein of unknown function (DUF3800)